MNCKVLNFRAFLIVSLFVTAIVLCVYCYAYNSAAGIVLGVLCIVGCCALAVLFIFRFIWNKSRLVVAISFSLAVVLCICAFSVGVTVVDKWASGERFNRYCSVSGRVCDVDTQTGRYRLFLDDLVLNGQSADGILRVDIAVSDQNIADIVRCGDTLQFGAKINTVNLARKDGKISGNAYRTGVRYTASVKSDGIVVQSVGNPRPLEQFSIDLRSHLTENMGEKYGNIAFSMLTGDKHGLGTGIFDYFSAAGLGHIMAVSGLHIGFLVLLLNFILCKVRKKIRFPIIAVGLFLYAVLADFSPSVVRAVIMAYVSGIGVLIGGRRDLLSSLLCAYSFILAVKPFYLFEAGFLLSFGALFGIAVFSGTIRRFTDKHRVPKKIGNAVGGSISVSVGILPMQAYFFQEVQILACLVNIIVLPYISITFITIICLLPISLIPHCGSVLVASKYLLMPLDYIAHAIAHLPYTVISLKSSSALFLCYPLTFIAGEHVMLGKSKTAVSWYSLAVCLAIIIVCAL
ncbi:MAG: competence protein ComEC family protein [Clostridiales bacterium]|nr:competence protein ComEC family protein [Clostridiales bacterium]